MQMLFHTDHEQTHRQILLSGPNRSHLFLFFHANVTFEAWDLSSTAGSRLLASLSDACSTSSDSVEQHPRLV